MGCVLDKACRSEAIEAKQQKINSLSREMRELTATNADQARRISELGDALKLAEDMLVDLRRYKTAMEMPDDMADYIMSTDIHLEWMDDKIEKSYIVSMFKAIHKFVESCAADEKTHPPNCEHQPSPDIRSDIYTDSD